jgi:hypothetical protein
MVSFSRGSKTPSSEHKDKDRYCGNLPGEPCPTPPRRLIPRSEYEGKPRPRNNAIQYYPTSQPSTGRERPNCVQERLRTRHTAANEEPLLIMPTHHPIPAHFARRKIDRARAELTLQSGPRDQSEAPATPSISKAEQQIAEPSPEWHDVGAPRRAKSPRLGLPIPRDSDKRNGVSYGAFSRANTHDRHQLETTHSRER